MTSRAADGDKPDRPVVLVVEDEWLIAIDIAEIVEAAGCTALGPVHSVSAAIDLLKGVKRVDGGLLDVNLRGETSYPIAKALTDREIPFAFLSGYASNQLQAGFEERPLLSKPVDPIVLTSCLAKLLGRS